MKENISGNWRLFMQGYEEGGVSVRSMDVPVQQQGQSVSIGMYFQLDNSRFGDITWQGTYSMGRLTAESSVEYRGDIGGAPVRVSLSLEGTLLPPDGSRPPGIEGVIRIAVLDPRVGMSAHYGNEQSFRMVQCEGDSPRQFWTMVCRYPG
jgi:hypothetical protein